jgi:putative serine protease PepD
MLVAAAVVIALVAGLIGGLIGSHKKSTKATNASSNSSTAGACDAETVAADVLPTIVTIAVHAGTTGGTGSGEIIKSDGYILTNNHVIAAAANSGTIEVLFSSGQTVPATLVGRDPLTDLAVIKVTTSTTLPTINIGTSSDLIVGQPVVALGAPLGLSGTVTSGIISALGRDVPVPSDNGGTAILAGAIQTDASINPGNSGGALVNCGGSLVGVNSAIATVPNEAGQSGGGSVGIGFAIPVDNAVNVSNQLIANGKVSYPYFGVSVTPIPASVAEKFNITDGLYVESVVPNGPTAQAGIQTGDVITEVNGQPAANAETLTNLAFKSKPGDTVKVTYLRDGQSNNTTVTLANRPGS